MSAQRLTVSAVRRLAQLSLRSSSSAAAVADGHSIFPRQTARPSLRLWHTVSGSASGVRSLSSKGRGGGKNKDSDDFPLEPPDDDTPADPFDRKYHVRKVETNPLEPKEPTEDPFGLNFDDGSDGLGPTLPPSYKRDKTTGAFTGEIENELSDADKELLKADDVQLDRKLTDSFEKHWEKEGLDESGSPKELNQLGKRVRESEMALNVLGRSVRAQASAEELDDGSELGRDKKGFTQQLTKQEYSNFAEFMKKKHGIEVSDDDLPVQENKSSRTKRMDAIAEEDPDHRALSLKWLTARAQRQLDDAVDDNPYSDLMPGDLSPNRLVSRKRAKPIPREVLHHNNVELLRHFVSPTGLIRNRSQTRLGARDQRKVAKAIKRARNLGLVPYAGQYKSENHGWKHAPDFREVKEWEHEMVERGLVIKKKAAKVEEEGADSSSDESSSA